MKMPYSIRDYGTMIADRARTDAYARAMREAIRPGDVVLDLGAGTGIFSLLACRFGARRVHACDPSAAVQLAGALGRDNGFGERIVCHQMPVDRLTLPEPVDVIVAELRGVLPLHERGVSALIDARTRLLRPGGVILPARDRLWIALASAPEQHARALTPWSANDPGFDLGAWSALLANTWMETRPRPSELASPPVLWSELDYRTVGGPNVRNRVSCVAAHDADVHGFFVWFDATIFGDVGFSGGPDAPALPYGCAFFPWLRPVGMNAGEAADIDLDATLVGDEYTWTWRTSVGDARFEQSTFFSSLSPANR